MTRTVQTTHGDWLPDASMFAALERADDTHLEKMDALFDWERFRAILEKTWGWTRNDAQPGRPFWDAGTDVQSLSGGKKTKGNVSDGALAKKGTMKKIFAEMETIPGERAFR